MIITNSQLNEIANKIINRFKKNPDDAPVHLMIKSWENYNDHKTNVFRDCLSSWSRYEIYKRSPFDFKTIYIDKDDIGMFQQQDFSQSNKRIFFVNTTIGQLKHYHLEYLINNENVISSSYMSQWIDYGVYSQYKNVA